MSDLTDDMLAAYASYEDCDRPLSDTELVQLAMAKELQRHRSAEAKRCTCGEPPMTGHLLWCESLRGRPEFRPEQSASAERVRSVVRSVAMVEVCAAVSWLMGPTYWHDNPSAHGRWEKTADAIANRVASQLAVPVLSTEAVTSIIDYVLGESGLGQVRRAEVRAEALDRLLGAKP